MKYNIDKNFIETINKECVGQYNKSWNEIEMQYKLISALKRCGAIKFGDFTLSSGKKSKYYIDIKKASTDPRTLEFIAECVSEKISHMHVEMVGGVALGGVPIATAVSLKTKLPLLLIRSTVKNYGTGSRFIGDLNQNSTIVLLEDVTTSGNSVIKAIKAIRDAGGVVDTVITIVDREEDAKKNLELVNVNLIALVSASELI